MAEPAKLPLNVRKNIRDAEPKRDAALAEINKITGKTFIVTPNFETNQPLIEGWGKDTIGDCYYGHLLQQFPKMLEKNLADPLFKEEFDNTVTNNEIVFKVGPVDRAKTGGQSTYNDVYFENGSLILTHTPSISNVDDIGNFNLVKVRGLNQSSKIPLFVRQNLKKNEAAKNEAMARISKATGNEWTFDENCIEPLWAAYVKNESSWGRYNESVGNFFYKDALANIAEHLETILKDDMVQEGFNEEFSAKTIEFRYVENLPTYWVPKKENGKFVVQFKDLCNFDNLRTERSFNITELL